MPKRQKKGAARSWSPTPGRPGPVGGGQDSPGCPPQDYIKEGGEGGGVHGSVLLKPPPPLLRPPLPSSPAVPSRPSSLGAALDPRTCGYLGGAARGALDDHHDETLSVSTRSASTTPTSTTTSDQVYIDADSTALRV